jgi:hypothetical protein
MNIAFITLAPGTVRVVRWPYRRPSVRTPKEIEPRRVFA